MNSQVPKSVFVTPAEPGWGEFPTVLHPGFVDDFLATARAESGEDWLRKDALLEYTRRDDGNYEAIIQWTDGFSRATVQILTLEPSQLRSGEFEIMDATCETRKHAPSPTGMVPC
jgi:hypothetical protein